MDANMEELEKRMGIKIEVVRDMMLDRFSGVDQKLTAIEQLLKKIIEPQSQTGNPPENSWKLIDKNTGEGGTESTETQDKGNKVAIGRGDGGPSHESGPSQAQISSDDGDQEADDQIQGSPGGLQLGDLGRQRPSHESELKKPLLAQISSDDDGQETDHQIRGPPGGLQLGDRGRQGPSHESGPEKLLQAQISSDDDDQETDHQIRGSPGELHLGDGDKQGSSHDSGPKKPLQAQISLDGDNQETDYQIRGPPGGHYLGDGGKQGPPHESGPKKPSRAQISSDGDDQETDYQIRGPPGGLYLGDGGRKGPRWEAGSSCGWVGLYTNHYGTYNPPGPEYSFGTDFCGPAWVGLKRTDFSKKNGPRYEGQLVNSFVEVCPETQRERVPEGFGSGVVNADVTGWISKKIQHDIVKGMNYSGEKGVKTGQDGIFKDGGNKPQTQVITEGSNEGRPKTRRRKRKAKKADVTGTTSSGKKVVKTCQDEKVADKTVAGGVDKKEEETDVLLQDSSNPDQWTKKDSDSWFKALCSNTDFHWRFPESDKSLDWSKLVETKVASHHGSGALWGKKGENKPQPQAVIEGSNEEGHEENQKAGSWGSKEEGCGFKAIHNETNLDWRFAESDRSRDWSKLVEAKVASHGSGALWGKKGDHNTQPQVITEGSNERGHEESQKPGSWGSKEEGCSFKRKHHPDSPVGDPNDCPISSGPFTTAKRRVDMFTTDEQDSHLNEIEPIMQSIRRIMHRYDDGDPLSANDQAYILENVFKHHPQKAQKMGAGVDYIMVSKHMKFQGSRCFYVVSTDGRKEDFSYHKCLKNFISAKYPNNVHELIPKYFKNS